MGKYSLDLLNALEMSIAHSYLVLFSFLGTPKTELSSLLAIMWAHVTNSGWWGMSRSDTCNCCAEVLKVCNHPGPSFLCSNNDITMPDIAEARWNELLSLSPHLERIFSGELLGP